MSKNEEVQENIMINNFNENEKYIIELLKKISEKESFNIYVVGGAVRDYLLNKKSNDIDICIVGDVAKVLKKLASIDEKITFKYHEKFQTSTIYYKDTFIDLIRCRDEIYEFHGALPKITPSNLYDDLKRRDFTINAIAYDIINDSFIDYFNGIEDIKNKKIRMIHKDSYNEDATRIIRAIKYANRLSFNISDEIDIKVSIESNVKDTISNDRFIKEISLLLEEEQWEKNLKDLAYFNLIKLNKDDLSEKYHYIKDESYEDKILKLYLSLNSDLEKEKFIDNSVINKDIKKSLKKYYNEKDIIMEKLEQSYDNFEIYQVLKQLDNIVIKLLSTNHNVFFKVYNYLEIIGSLYDASIIKKYNLQLQNKKDIGKLIRTYNKVRLNIIYGIKYEDFLKIEERV